MLPLAVQAAQAAIEKICPEAQNLLVIPENHSRNTFYLANVAQLVRIFHMAGLNVRIGSIDPAIKSPKKIELPNGEYGAAWSRWCAASAGWGSSTSIPAPSC